MKEKATCREPHWPRVVKKIECPEPTPGAAVTARLESDVQYVMEEVVPANLMT
jgi:hypothetical protein